jgi:hypothetical protein
MRLPDRAGYHRVRTPYVSEGEAARVTNHHAALCQPLRAPELVEEEASA